MQRKSFGVAALVALGQVDFAGIVHSHFNRHGVFTETERITAPWERRLKTLHLSMVVKEKPEYFTPAGVPLSAMDIYYRFLSCGFTLPVSAGSASGVMPSPLGLNRAYVKLGEKFGYRKWFQELKAGRSFATNGPMLFLTVEGHEPGFSIKLSPPTAAPARLKVRAEAVSTGPLDRMELVWKGQVARTVREPQATSTLNAEFEHEAKGSDWIATRAFERPAGYINPAFVDSAQGRRSIMSGGKSRPLSMN